MQRVMISPAVRRQLQEKLQEARRLSGERPCDHRRVHALLAECLDTDPGNTIYINALLQNLRWQHRQGKQRSWLTDWLVKRRFQQALRARDWRRVLQLGPAALARDSREPVVFIALAEACAELDYPHAELRYLQEAIAVRPEDVNTLRQLARSLTRHGQYDEAREVWRKILDVDRGDEEAGRTLAALTANPQVQHASSAVLSELEERWTANLGDIAACLTLADAYCSAARFDDAERVLSDALAKSGGELRLRERLEELVIDRSRQKVAIAQQRATANPRDAACDLVRELQAEHNRLELGLYHTRCERYPKRPALKLELAVRLKRAGNYSGAIEQLQQVINHDDLAAMALVELGECFQQLRQFDKALESYRSSLARLGEQHTEPVKLALYRVGTLAAAMGQTATAKEHFHRLVSIDPTYKNARERLDKLAEICDKS